MQFVVKQPHLVDIGWNGFAAHAHSLAVNEVSVFPVCQASHHNTLFGSNHCAHHD